MGLNPEQRAYSRDMNSLPRDQVCWCGWYPVAKCPNCPPHLTAADRAKVECHDCHNYPHHSNPTGPITHRIGCSNR